MAQEPLVERRIEDGRRLIEALVASGFDIQAAFWLYLPEGEEWRLMIGTREIERRGRLETYRAIGAVQESLPALSIESDRVGVLRPDAPIIKGAVALLKKFPNPIVKRLRPGALGDVYVEDAYIYPKLPVPEAANQS